MTCRLRRHPILQDSGRVAFAQPLERPIAELTHTLARDAEFASDLLQRHRPVALEAEVEDQHSTITRREHLERAANRLAPRVTLDAARKHVLVLAAVEHEGLAKRPAGFS